MPMRTLPDLTGLSLGEIARLAESAQLPPVESWQPAHCGSSGMRIARDGTWFHEGSPIGRPAMVALFSTLLRREEDGRHVLVTPVEKLDIDVELAPFTAVEMTSDGSGRDRRLAFRLNTGDLVVAGPTRPIRIEDGEDGPVPLLRVRGELDALIARPVYYELAELAIADGGDPAGVWSDGAFFPITGGDR
ncbi:DUF1285 domain-containing protein [Sphingomonas jejuensis]|nr:DUF1285 domain-containing protein [Sphingomonas jejuensis]